MTAQRLETSADLSSRAWPWPRCRLSDLGGAAGDARAVVGLTAAAGAPAGTILRLPLERLDSAEIDLGSDTPLAVMLAGARNGRDVQRLGAGLAVCEARRGLADGSIGIVAEIATGAGLLELASFAGCSRRLIGLGWDAPALARDLGAASAWTADGALIEPCRTARALTLAAAAAADVPAIDGASEETDDAAFRREVAAARRDGFSAKIASSDARAALIAPLR